MIVAIASRKASPGATTLAALLAKSWQEDGTTRFVVEADPSGGTLAARWSESHGVSWNPGLVDLALLRGSHGAASLAHAAQPLSPEVHLFAAPPAPGQVINALTTMGDAGAAMLAGSAGARSFVDCGRLDSRSAALPLARRAVVTLVVMRPILEEINSAFAGVVELSASGCTVGLVTVGKGHWSSDEIANAAGVEVFGELPDDPKAAQIFASRGLHAGRLLQRSQLTRAVAELASNLQLVSACVRVPSAPPADVPSPDTSLTTSPVQTPQPRTTSTLPPPPAPASRREPSVWSDASIDPPAPSTNGVGP